MSVRILRGINEPLGRVFAHGDIAGIDRFSFSEIGDIRGKLSHIAVHVISDNYVYQEEDHYTESHKHDFDEINILISTNSCLEYNMSCDGRSEVVASPSLIHIPAGTEHRAEAIRGTGVFICIYLDRDVDKRKEIGIGKARNGDSDAKYK
jgi:mannose-6-phosphate isomerase-like protein (cupin superfamily)